jgi:hypothetical protein
MPPGFPGRFIKTMHRIAILVVPLLALLLATSSATAVYDRHNKMPATCSSGHTRSIAADVQAQIFETPMSLAHPEFLSIYGCSYKHKRSYLLGPAPYGSPSGAGGVETEVLAGSVVAYEEASNQSCCQHWWVVVRDLNNGHVLHRIPTGTRVTPRPLSVGIGQAVDIVVKRNGSVAWIVETNAEEGEYQVHAVDSSGSRTLASSPEVDSTSLALAGSTLYWTQGGRPLSATLN